jgi:hypothetical protein
VLGHGFDINAALGAGHDHRPGDRAVDEDGEIQLAGNFHGFRDQNLPHHPPLGAGLVGDERLAEHLGGDVARLAGGFAKVDSAFEPVGESSFSASSGMDLSFDHQVVRAQGPCHSLGFL